MTHPWQKQPEAASSSPSPKPWHRGAASEHTGATHGAANVTTARGAGTDVDTPLKVRLALLQNGYLPIPANGKACYINGWSSKTATNESEIRVQAKQYRDHTNTGVLTRSSPALDIDIRILPAAEAIEALARDMLEERGHVMVRIGEPPKRAILLRTDEPFKKMSRVLVASDGSAHKIEMLGDGEQIIVDGIHPDTAKPYVWHGGSPLTIPRNDLPYVRRDDLERFLDDAARLLIDDYGFAVKGATRPESGNGADNGAHVPAEWGELIGNIVSGADLHDSTTVMAAKLVRGGRADGAAVNLSRAKVDDLKVDDLFEK